MIFVFIFFRSVRSFVLELALWLCATNLLFNINIYFPIIDNIDDNWCIFQGMISTIGDLSTIIWTTIIGFFSYISVVNSKFIENNKNIMRLFFILIANLIPGTFTIM